MPFDELRTDTHDIIFFHEDIASGWCAILDYLWCEVFDYDDVICHLRHTSWVDGLDLLFRLFSLRDDLLEFYSISLLHEDIHLDFTYIVFASLAGECFESDLHFASFLLYVCHSTLEWRDLSEILRIACFEELFNARKTCCDIASFLRDSSRVEGAHRELCPWFTDRLSSDDTHWCTDLHDICCGEIETVAPLTYTLFCLTGEYRSDRDLRSTRIHDRCEYILRDEGTDWSDHLTTRIDDILRCELTIDLVLEGITEESLILTAIELFVLKSIAIIFSYQDILCGIDESTSEIS